MRWFRRPEPPAVYLIIASNGIAVAGYHRYHTVVREPGDQLPLPGFDSTQCRGMIVTDHYRYDGRVVRTFWERNDDPNRRARPPA